MGDIANQGGCLYHLKFSVLALPKTQNKLNNQTWQTRISYAKKWLRIIGSELIGKLPEKPLKSFKLNATRYSSQKPDYDNLVGSFKPLIDALKKQGLIYDDSPNYMKSVHYAWEYAGPKQGKITIEVTELCEESNGKS